MASLCRLPPTMPTPQSWLFTRIDPDDNLRRFYYIALQPALLDRPGQWSVLRVYGRIGGGQQEMAPRAFEDWASARAYAEKLVAARVRRGYVLVG